MANAARSPSLRDDPETLKALVSATAEAIGIDVAFIEKDFWVMEVLRAATRPCLVTDKEGANHAVSLIFKGGTSLSRAHQLIERFSEDVDLLVAFPPDAELSLGARDRVLKAICAEVQAHLGLTDEACARITSTTGVKRNVRYLHPAGYPSTDVTEGVLLEMGCRGGTYPTARHSIRSMIAEHAVDRLGDEEDAWEEFTPVDVVVLEPVRTLFEKLSLLHDAASRYSPGQSTPLTTAGRHLYDVHQLLGATSVREALEALGSDGREGLCADIDQHSDAAEFSFTPRPATGFADSPVADPDHPAQAVARRGYETAMALVYGHKPTYSACLAAIRDNARLL